MPPAYLRRARADHQFETGGRGKGQWFWKVPMVDLVEDDKGGHEPIKDARVPKVGEGGTLNEDGDEAMKDAKAGTLKESAHGYPDGKGCYLCASDHPYRKAGGAV